MADIVYQGKCAKLSTVISDNYPTINYNTLRKLFRKGDIRVNGRKIYSDMMIADRDIIRVYYKVSKELKIIYENDDIAVFFKPVKMASIGENSFANAVREQFPDYKICHRLDTNTDGLILFAKNLCAFEELKKVFKLKNIEKHYITAVYGELKSPGELTHYLVKNGLGSVKIYNNSRTGALKIITRYTPIEVRNGLSILDVELVTGRTHQIRAHFAHIGYPVIGDSKYGSVEVNRKYNKNYQILRAYKLIFHIKNGYLSYMDGLTIELDKEEYISSLKL